MALARPRASIAALGVLAASASAAALLTAPAQAAAGNGRVPVTAATVLPSAAAVPSAQAVRVSVSVGRDASGMTALARAISSPGSSRYEKFLSPAQVQAQFGTTGTQQAAVRQWLRSAGLTISYTSPYMITGTGSAAQASTALGAQVGSVRVHSGSTSQTELVARGGITAPAALAGIVNAVNLSAKNPAPLPPPETSLAKPATKIKGPCSAYFGQKTDTKVPPAYGGQPSFGSCWYTPAQTRSAYGIPSSLSGQGETVATMGSEPLAGGLRSLQRWSADNGIPALRPGQLTMVNVTPPKRKPGALDEWLGDLEAVHGLAPNANLVYVNSNGSISGDPFADDLNAVVTNRLADLVSASIGDTIYWDHLLNPVLKRAALEGITVNEASGDWGNLVDKSPRYGGYLRDTPWETMVGGTSLAIGAQGQYLWETPWAQTSSSLNKKGTAWTPKLPGPSEYYFEGGGGVTREPEPWYQQGVVSNNVVDGQAKRVGPDVSMEADCFVGGYPEGYYQPTSPTKAGHTWYTRPFCGTSMASPMFTALEANLLQERHGLGLGFANPTLYNLYNSTAFHQVTSTPLGTGVTTGVVITPASQLAETTTLITVGQCQAEDATSKPFPLITPYCGTGYNEVTGLGSPAPGLFSLLGPAS
ncbi:MAG TPA: protease pro-enzyme activation domain-containing protein [Streptosporangiaceae bacterium]|jgi:subtilase family serine protease|nr:protease pro-enzyme activation domain-containing protein [Streptosporangiaceae bacterium]